MRRPAFRPAHLEKSYLEQIKTDFHKQNLNKCAMKFFLKKLNSLKALNILKIWHWTQIFFFISQLQGLVLAHRCFFTHLKSFSNFLIKMSLEQPIILTSQLSPDTPCFLLLFCWSRFVFTGLEAIDDVEDFLRLLRVSTSLLVSLFFLGWPTVPQFACELEKLHSHFRFRLACCCRTLYTCINKVFEEFQGGNFKMRRIRNEVANFVTKLKEKNKLEIEIN